MQVFQLQGVPAEVEVVEKRSQVGLHRIQEVVVNGGRDVVPKEGGVPAGGIVAAAGIE